MAGRLPRVTGATGVVDTAGEGGFFGGIIYPGVAGGITETIGTADRVYVYQFVLPFRAGVGRITFNVSTQEASTLTGIGLYDINKNRLLHTGAVSVAASGVKSITITTVTLEPGIYYQAWTIDGTTAALFGWSGVSSGTISNIFVAGTATKVGRAANAGSSGVLPTALGTITADVTKDLPAVFYEP